MQNPNDKLTINQCDPSWYFIADYSLEDSFAEEIDPDCIPASLDQTVRELSLSSDYRKQIHRAIVKATRAARNKYDPGKSRIPVQVCLFLQRKMIEGAGDTANQCGGGWGYFFIQRAKENSSAACLGDQLSLELYIYKEGS